ncbi:sensor histidine kinase [Streptomyces montanus]|uniref:histidine kinase n=1 Tax=Streptomyces montanus TaxID=2580423 RepID=A0A5R9G5L5_9ACTN|nr:histidine kinase [Streptomyces montanus]TLS46825.1 sensor histidine kinase [Streptomyces montanus]
MTSSPQQLLRNHPRAVDSAVAAAVFVCSVPGSVFSLPGRDPGVPWWPGVLLAGASCVALVWRRDRPRTTVVVTTVCGAGMAALGYFLTVLLPAPLMVALHSLAARTRRRTANSFACAAIALLVATELAAGPGDEPLVLQLFSPAWLLLATSLGTASRLQRACLEAVRARAEHAERTREEEARRRVAEERMRIARDLHDVVAHHLVLANLQAGAVARYLPARPEQAEATAACLTETTASALRELKATVGLLRQADDTEQPACPAPGLASLPDLAASFHGAGLRVTVTTVGAPRPLSAGADLTAYRIVQEALTNVTKHACTGTAEVRLTFSRDRLSLTVANGGTRAPADSRFVSGGYGLIGMRERAVSVGGRLHAGPRPRGGFEVVAELPLPPVPPEEPHGATDLRVPLHCPVA